MSRLEGKVALITGAASGIGAACARRFAAEGASLAGFDLAEPSEGDWIEAAKAAPRASFWSGDVRDEATIERVVAEASEAFGCVDVVVNAAGVSGISAAADLDAAEWDRVVDINLKGTFLVCKHTLRGMLKRDGGSIVNIASVEGLEGADASTAYNVSKGGVIQLTRSMAVDYGKAGVRVNCLCPGYIETPMTEMLNNPALSAIRDKFIGMHLLGRGGKPEEVAACALFLASDEASFVHGHALVVDGGFMAGRSLTG
jgi:meso-butanediol dehydrogenase/(S,S)-butanediol dehydrogenase/diacetyl reductase